MTVIFFFQCLGCHDGNRWLCFSMHQLSGAREFVKYQGSCHSLQRSRWDKTWSIDHQRTQVCPPVIQVNLRCTHWPLKKVGAKIEPRGAPFFIAILVEMSLVIWRRILFLTMFITRSTSLTLRTTWRRWYMMKPIHVKTLDFIKNIFVTISDT